MRKKIYLLVAGVDYEGGSTVRAYESKSACEDAIKQCVDYHDTRPLWCDDDADAAAIEAWEAAFTQWQASHPAGVSGSTCDYFIMHEVDFIQDQKAMTDQQTKDDGAIGPPTPGPWVRIVGRGIDIHIRVNDELDSTIVNEALKFAARRRYPTLSRPKP